MRVRVRDKVSRSYYIFGLFFLLLGAFWSCRLEQKKPGEKLLIVCTTGMIGDVVDNLCGDIHQVERIMGPGVDPHLYKPTPSDIRLLQNADVIVHNGLHLEGKMGEIFDKLQNEKLIIKWSDGIEESDLMMTTENEDSHDPHIWFDTDLFIDGAHYFTIKLTEYDTVNANQIQINFTKYNDQVRKKKSEFLSLIDQIPSEKRILITSHDAFSYFGRDYGFEVRGLQGISTVSEFGIKDKIDLVDYIISNDVHVLFVESSVSSKSLESVVETCEKRGHEIKIGGTLLSDAMDDEGTLGGTYLGMIEHNIKTILEGING